MNEQLYNQFLDAASVMIGVQKFDEAINTKTDEWSDKCGELLDAQDRAKSANKSYGKWTGWGVFFMIFGFVNALLYSAAVVIAVFGAILEGTSFYLVEIIPLMLVVGFLFFVGFLGMCLFVAARIKRKKRVKKAKKECAVAEVEIQAQIDKIEEEIEYIKGHLREFADENEHLIQFLPSSYRNPHAIGFMLKAIENLRANTLTDVINLYEQELHFLEQRSILQNNAEMQRIHNENMLYAMETINRNQERMNSNLQFIQAMQIINMLDD